jgi:uncharacterized protein (TIGR02246 family)
MLWHVLFVITIVLSILSAGSAYAAGDPQNVGKLAKSQQAPPWTAANFPKEIDILLTSLKQAVVEGNSQSAAALWTANAIFIDESGEETRGRNALQERFESLFQERQKKSNSTQQIEFEPERVLLPSENVALVVGVVSKRTGAESNAATRFSMTLEKQKGLWLISQATETRIAASSACEHLCELDWLIGDWKTTTAKGSAALKVEWAPGKNFINITCITTDKESALQTTDRQVIGWDERTGSIVSWFFGYHGNFAYGRWRRNDANWLVNVAGIGSNGTDMKSTDIYSFKATGQFLWQSVSRSKADTNLPDTESLTVEKVSSGGR